MLSEYWQPVLSSLAVIRYNPSVKLKIVSFKLPLFHNNDIFPEPPLVLANNQPSLESLQDITEPL